VFILWLCNQRYYNRDVIGIKMTYRDLPYYEGIRAKTRRECKVHVRNPFVANLLLSYGKSNLQPLYGKSTTAL